MMLTLSAASSLYWLGRYMLRVEALCHLLPFEDDTQALAYAHSFSLSAWNVETLLAAIHDPQRVGSLPNNLAVIQDNIQAVRGILPRPVFEAFNALWRQREQADSCICDLLTQSATQLQQLDAVARGFWQLGRAVESVDMALRLHAPVQPAADHLLQIAQQLPMPEWQLQVELVAQLVDRPDVARLYALCDRLHLAFVEGSA
ncbi:MAG: alpha-E domain-containing protein [Moraxellaceae bacterium]